ncbi:MAG: hypothetical protein ACEQSM_06040 [Aliarcobacter sp.]
MSAILTGKEVKQRLKQFPHATVTSISMPAWIYVLSRLVLLNGEPNQNNFSEFVRKLVDKYLSSEEIENCEFSVGQIETILDRCRQDLKADLIRRSLGLGQNNLPAEEAKRSTRRTGKDPADVLKELKRLLQAGVITDADHTKQKEEILKSLRT